jgi:hypothetical protein
MNIKRDGDLEVTGGSEGKCHSPARIGEILSAQSGKPYSLQRRMVSLRLRNGLIDELKRLAQESEIGYQYYIQDVLLSHIQSKKAEKTE